MEIKRIEWVDIYKAILIILVVVGHSTGLFNNYIYQFHMAAFFFISGYIANFKNKTVVHTFYNKFHNIMIPLGTVFVLLLLITALLNKVGIYSLFFNETLPYRGIVFTIKEFLGNGLIYVWWLGAAWFLIELFKVFIIQKVLFSVLGKRINSIFCLVSIILLLYGYYSIGAGTGHGKFALTFIAQFYFVVGMIFKNKNIFEKLEVNYKKMLFVGLITIMGLYYFGNIRPTTVDYPSYKFSNLFFETIAAVNGIVFTYCISKILEHLNWLKKGLCYLGRNTLPIVLLHFIFFNLTFFLLYCYGKVSLRYLQNFIPTEAIGNEYWVLNTIISIIMSLITWELLIRIPGLGIMLGKQQNLFKQRYEGFRNRKNFVLFERFMENLEISFVCEKPMVKKIVVIILIILVLVGISVNYIPAVSVGEVFETKGIYEDHWVGESFEFKIKSGENGIVAVNGYIPWELLGNELVSFWVDGKEETFDIRENNFTILLEVDSNKIIFIKGKSHFLRKAEPPDIRELSYVLTITCS